MGPVEEILTSIHGCIYEYNWYSWVLKLCNHCIVEVNVDN